MLSAESRPRAGSKVNSHCPGPHSSSIVRSGRPRPSRFSWRTEDVVDLVVAVLGQVLEAVRDRAHPRRVRGPARLLRLQHGVFELGDVQLDLEPGDVVVAACPQPVAAPAAASAGCRTARARRRRSTCRKAPSRCSGVHGSTRKVVGSGTRMESGPPASSVMPTPPPEANMRREDVVGGVHVQRRALEVLAVAQREQEVVGGEGLAADDTVLVAPGHPDRAQPLLLDLGDDPLGGLLLLVAPELVALDEADLADAQVLKAWHRSTSGSCP